MRGQHEDHLQQGSRCVREPHWSWHLAMVRESD